MLGVLLVLLALSLLQHCLLLLPWPVLLLRGPPGDSRPGMLLLQWSPRCNPVGTALREAEPLFTWGPGFSVKFEPQP
jgi:hypothetical protein